MRKVAWLTLVAVVCFSFGSITAADKKVNPKEELKKFQGNWKLTTWITGSRDNAVDGHGVYIEGDEWEYLIQGKSKRKDRITINPNAEPKQIDLKLSARTQVLYGIYRFNDDGTLEICWAKQLSDASKRPTKFSTKREAGSGEEIRIWEKEKK